MTGKRLVLNIFLVIIIIILLAAITYGAFFIYKINRFGDKITFSKNDGQSFLDTIKSISYENKSTLKGEENNRINLLLLGIAGKGKPGQNLTDTIMVASVNPKNNQVALLSIPRDLYVTIPESKISMKINSVYQYGIRSTSSEREGAELMREIISGMTGLDINYYVILNFDGFIRVVDSVGPINITNERDIYDARYPGPNYSYETFELGKGFHSLDGATALKYARERHDDPLGDFGRAKRQQQILAAVKSKVFSAGTMLNPVKVNEVFNALGDNIKTDISPDEFGSFWELTKRADTNNINTSVVDAWNKDSLLKVSHVSTGMGPMFILMPRIGNWSEVQELASNMFDLNAIKRRKEAIAGENAKVVIINKSGYSPLTDRIKKLLSDNFSYKNVVIIYDNDTSDENNTFIYDFSNGLMPFTTDELIKKLPAQSSSNLGKNYQKDIQNISPDLVVVLGRDIVDKYNMAEDSFDEYNKASDTNEYTEFLDN